MQHILNNSFVHSVLVTKKLARITVCQLTFVVRFDCSIRVTWFDCSIRMYMCSLVCSIRIWEVPFSGTKLKCRKRFGWDVSLYCATLVYSLQITELYTLFMFISTTDEALDSFTAV